MIMLILRPNIFRYIYVELQIRGNTAKLYFFKSLQKNVWRNDHINSVAQYSAIHVDVELQIRVNTAKLDFPETFKKVYEEMTI